MPKTEDGNPEARIGRRSFLAGSVGAAALLKAGPSAAQMPPLSLPDEWTNAQVLPLWDGTLPGGSFVPQTIPQEFPPFAMNVSRPSMRVFRPAVSNGRALLSIPGGAYKAVSFINEGLDIARAMTAKGYTVFVLFYRLPGEGWSPRQDVPLQDVQRAMRLIRAQAGRWGVDAEQIYAVGFSAGGHLAATLATGFAEHVYAPADKTDALTARPRAVGLVYPVITHEKGIGHVLSSELLLGPNPSPEQVQRRSPALHVSPETPPTFLVHAFDDQAVPIENSMIMLEALRKQKRPVEAHFFESGNHGFGLGKPGTPASHWIEAFQSWLDQHAT